MKKEYGSPKAEKVAFDYSEVVLAASGANACHWEQKDGFTLEGCINSQTGPGYWAGETAQQ